MSTPNTPTKTTNAWSTKQLVTMALMCAIGVLLSFIEFPLLPGVTWLKFDASNMPAMVSGFAFGPGAGVAVGILTAIIHGLLMADFTGALMNVLTVTCFVLPAAIIYKKKRTYPAAIGGLVLSIIAALAAAVRDLLPQQGQRVRLRGLILIVFRAAAARQYQQARSQQQCPYSFHRFPLCGPRPRPQPRAVGAGRGQRDCRRAGDGICQPKVGRSE